MTLDRLVPLVSRDCWVHPDHRETEEILDIPVKWAIVDLLVGLAKEDYPVHKVEKGARESQARQVVREAQERRGLSGPPELLDRPGQPGVLGNLAPWDQREKTGKGVQEVSLDIRVNRVTPEHRVNRAEMERGVTEERKDRRVLLVRLAFLVSRESEA